MVDCEASTVFIKHLVDRFHLKDISDEYFETSEVYIFNRYGKLLKSSYNQSFSWDGTFNNMRLPTSDYWYIIKIEDQEFRGHFTLKR
jgi:gliding motility-associated-like protein